MKKILSGIMYGILLGFAVLLFGACIFLIINTAKRNDRSYSDMEAVMIDDEGESDDTAYDEISAEVSTEMPYGYRAVELKYAYNALDSKSKKYLYEQISGNIYSVSNEKDDKGHYRIVRLRINGERMSESEVREALYAYIYDNPHIFWLDNIFGYGCVGEDTIIDVYSVLSADECEDCIELFNKKVDDIMSSLKPGLSDYDREKSLHDRLLNGCRYNDKVKSSKDGWHYFSAYGAIVLGDAVCEGYAKAMQILLSKAGLPCLTIRGESIVNDESEKHMWNVVELENEWYHLDATWDDNDKDEFVTYEYFNVDSENINVTHKINADIETVRSSEKEVDVGSKARYNFFVPLCTSMNMNYYNREAVFIDEFDNASDTAVISEIVKKINGGEHYIYIRFGDSIEYSEYINMMFYKSPYKYYYYIDHANDMLDVKISKKDVSVLKNENNSTLRMKLVTEENE